jgi:hypothetical protein
MGEQEPGTLSRRIAMGREIEQKTVSVSGERRRLSESLGRCGIVADDARRLLGLATPELLGRRFRPTVRLMSAIELLGWAVQFAEYEADRTPLLDEVDDGHLVLPAEIVATIRALTAEAEEWDGESAPAEVVEALSGEIGREIGVRGLRTTYSVSPVCRLLFGHDDGR